MTGTLSNVTCHLCCGVFERIRKEPAEFAKVSIDTELGALCWPNGADIDAELLRYDDLWRQTERTGRGSLRST